LFTKVEKLISSRNLKPKKKEGFLKVISAFSFIGIMLGVAILIIVMSVMNGFRTDLTNKILGLNPHIVIEPNGYTISNDFKKKLKKKYKKILLSESFSGEGVILTRGNAKGVIIKGVSIKEKNSFNFLREKMTNGNLKNFKDGTAIIGAELAFSLGLSLGDNINITSSTFLSTPLGGLPKQENYKISGIFNSGFYEYDKNMIFINIKDTLSIFDITKKDLSLELYLEDPLLANKYKKEITNLGQNFYIYSWTDLNKSFFSALKVERNVMFIILTLIIIVAAFNIISGLTILIKNKTREIAILKTMGLSYQSIMKSFFLTGLTIGLYASVAGVILGVFFSIFIEEIRLFFSNVFNLEIFPSEVYFLEKMPSEINFLSILMIFLFSLTITAFASYFPARAISKMDTTKALKYD
tara:strand:- start:6438 stop:7670 length:1233 start_codon:yes stop_codon:yes gene_type:complete